MKISDILRLSFENLRRRIGRTILTVIGVVVGTSAIVVMVSMGIASNQGFEEMLAQWGDLTMIEVNNWGSNESTSEPPPLTDEAVESFMQIENVVVATPMYRPRYYYPIIVSGSKDRYQNMGGFELVGIYPQAAEALGYELLSGEYLPLETVNLKRNSDIEIPVVVGSYFEYGFSDTRKSGENSMRWPGQTDMAGNPLPSFVDLETDTITMKENDNGTGTVSTTEYELDVVGVMAEGSDYFTHYGALMDINLLKQIEEQYMRDNKITEQDSQSGYDTVKVKVNDVDNVSDVVDILEEQGFGTWSMEGEREQMQEQSRAQQMLLGGIGAVSLFVAALSIVNTMTMAIYERTREIGVMKVLGCEVGRVRTMFLLEAGMIGFFGGLLGVLLSYLLSFLLNTIAPMMMSGGMMNMMPMYGEKISVIPWWLSLAALLFSTFVGVVSGILPARRAVRISALEAIRHE